MKKVLILGGTRFFGKRLAEKLEELGCDITIATRGNADTSFLKNGRHLEIDRFNRKSLEKAAQEKWDVIYDQICFSSEDALNAAEIFKDRVNKYIFTSTLSVYDINEKEEKYEHDFDPWKYPLKRGRREDFSYGEGKRQAEALFFQKASFPVTAVRPPIVLGEDDYTERLHKLVRKVLKNEAIGIDQLDNKLSFVDSDDLASFLLWCGEQKIEGPVNASAPDQISHQKMIKEIERAAGKEAILVSSSEAEASPMNFAESIYQNTDRVEQFGYYFRPLSSWFRPLVELIVEKEKQEMSEN
ncbi:NAD-dependent epimerase/dehydratase family protein [Alkalicoccus halolimnae]|uniref:NAD-dependent epimerase/dehydratase family protein n=1 Tax=Alkalicoccus halolimnae TaxID=1667239 RepID=A0A5C7FP95_9BACI|nr:NAD-dependent epimerase/dehydratase family protein [Alkalicoccus halolimnae]TXF86565.1 NAD-dependent epimerase/dehydratase family protein [Alkalicoccus halolimnae]